MYHEGFSGVALGSTGRKWFTKASVLRNKRNGWSHNKYWWHWQRVLDIFGLVCTHSPVPLNQYLVTASRHHDCGFQSVNRALLLPLQLKKNTCCNSGSLSPWSRNITRFDRRRRTADLAQVRVFQHHIGQRAFIPLWLQCEIWSVWQLLRQMHNEARRASGRSSGCALVLNRGDTCACFFQHWGLSVSVGSR